VEHSAPPSCSERTLGRMPIWKITHGSWERWLAALQQRPCQRPHQAHTLWTGGWRWEGATGRWVESGDHQSIRPRSSVADSWHLSPTRLHRPIPLSLFLVVKYFPVRAHHPQYWIVIGAFILVWTADLHINFATNLAKYKYEFFSSLHNNCLLQWFISFVF
jgi:hypothetical protein